MTKREKETRAFMYKNLQNLGFSFDDCEKLRRISMTLRRWYELECGTENAFGTSFAVERGYKSDEDHNYGSFVCNFDGKPWIRVGRQTKEGYKVSHHPTADKEKGAIKRLEAIIKPFRRKLFYYLQTDPRGAALYIVPYSQLRRYKKSKAQIDCCYSSVGICVY